ncbi:terminase large subunit domain-containing protein [Bacillus cereus]
MENKAYMYAEKVLSGEIVAPSQVRKQCENFIREYDVLQHQDGYEFYWNHDTEQDIDTILNLLNFARGAKAGQSIGENLALWQWFLILNTFCWQYKPTEKIGYGKRKIKEVVVTVSRKNSKSILACLVHIIAFFLDGENATHYCASNTRDQAKIVFDELSSIILSSPKLVYQPYEGAPLELIFNVRKTYIDFKAKRGKLKVLSGDSRRSDGIMPFVATIDECGADNEISKMIASIETGQMGVRNPIRFKISTSYGIENAYNYWQEVIDNLVKNTMADNPNPHVFGLVYNIDTPTEPVVIDGVEMERWEDKSTWLESNPLVAEVPELLPFLIESYETKKTYSNRFP